MPSLCRNIKSRSGCQPCKRRHVKCDEAKPTCARCARRGETCTGNFDLDTWQIEQPYLYALRPIASSSTNTAPSSRPLNYAPENHILRHWYDHACLVMAIVPPPMNPLSYPISPYLHRSKAARHAVQCVSQAHMNRFSAKCTAQVLEERSRALVALQHEIERVSRSPQPFYMRTILLSSLLLGISSGWLTPDDRGLEFLSGARHVVEIILRQNSKSDRGDACLHYLLGLYVWWETISSFTAPARALLPSPSSGILSVPSFVQTVVARYLSVEIHPVTGIASDLFALLAEVGCYYRWTVDTLNRDQAQEAAMEARLRQWSPSVPTPDPPDGRWWTLLSLAQAYRALGIIMLHQARSLAGHLTYAEEQDRDSEVENIMAILKEVPLSDPIVNSEAPLLVIAGSELRADQPELRDLVNCHVEQLTIYTGVPAFSSVLKLVQGVWRRRDHGVHVTWLSLMVSQGITLSLA